MSHQEQSIEINSYLLPMHFQLAAQFGFFNLDVPPDHPEAKEANIFIVLNSGEIHLAKVSPPDEKCFLYRRHYKQPIDVKSLFRFIQTSAKAWGNLE